MSNVNANSDSEYLAIPPVREQPDEDNVYITSIEQPGVYFSFVISLHEAYCTILL
ncbi:hypothetical protein HanIR_Chr15g0775981 [Helianthus annuus]|nr:hypothetical protein HanIR_Chr15g0775981 [Helianthus annuus]